MISEIFQFIKNKINLKSYSGYKFLFFQVDETDKVIIVLSMEEPIFSFWNYQANGRKIFFETEFYVSLKDTEKLNKIVVRTKDLREDYERIVREIDM